MKSVQRIVTGLLLATALSAVAGEQQSLSSIRQAVKVFLQEQTAGDGKPPRITVGRLDPRLRLTACPQPLEASLPAGSRIPGATSVQVRCDGPKPWSLYVQARVELFEQVLVTARPLSRGRVLEASDLKREERAVSRLRGGYFTERQAVVGMKLRRALGNGVPVTGQMVEKRKVVRRGERVVIRARSGGLEVSMTGKALTDGAKGDLIGVENLSSEREVEARVVAPGTVQVRM